GVVAGLVDPLDQLAFVVGLPEIDRYAQLGAALAARGLDVTEGLASIDFGLAHAKHVEIWPVEHEHGWLRSHLERSDCRSAALFRVGYSMGRRGRNPRRGSSPPAKNLVDHVVRGDFFLFIAANWPIYAADAPARASGPSWFMQRR